MIQAQDGNTASVQALSSPQEDVTKKKSGIVTIKEPGKNEGIRFPTPLTLGKRGHVGWARVRFSAMKAEKHQAGEQKELVPLSP